MPVPWSTIHFDAFAAGAHAALLEQPTPMQPSHLLQSAAERGADAMLRTLGSIDNVTMLLMAEWIVVAATNHSGPCEIVVCPGPLFWDGLFDHPNDAAEA
jgi:hypothetical protein